MSGPPGGRTDEKSGFSYRKMLILDDDAGVSRTVALMASSLGLQVETCTTLIELEAKLGTFEPDVLLIDLMMPGVDGLEAIARIRPACNAEIYVMSGADRRTYEASQNVLRSTSEQIAGFIKKPFTSAKLAALLSQPISASPKFEPVQECEEEQNLLDPDAFLKIVNSGNISPFFQPIFHARTRLLKGFEALLRINGKTENKFRYEYFEYLKASSPLSATVSDRMIRDSLRFLASLGPATDISVSINVFGLDAVADGFRERLIDQCAVFDVAPHRVILELSEATVCEFNKADMRKITQLRLAGFGLSIDDFGTQNSSLQRLANLPFSELKIDKSFCLALPASDPIAAIVEACLGIAHKLDMEVTAEGVETREVADMLDRMGCDALQGYYFGKAMPHSEAVEWIVSGCSLPGQQSRQM